MSYYEAKEDGIEIVGRYFNIPCSLCREEYVRSYSYSRDKVYACKACKDTIKATENKEKYMRKELKFDDAVNRITKQVSKIEEYQEAIGKVHKTLHRAGWYRSTEEIMVAIELLKQGIKTIHQQKIGRYKVDFVLPEYKVLLEIDGKTFHNNSTTNKEGIRDGEILLNIGCDWEMIRIDTDKINKDIQKLVPSIKAILEHRRKRK